MLNKHQEVKMLHNIRSSSWKKIIVPDSMLVLIKEGTPLATYGIGFQSTPM
jgi:hypothetical protein